MVSGGTLRQAFRRSDMPGLGGAYHYSFHCIAQIMLKHIPYSKEVTSNTSILGKPMHG